jgi:hypothetical protein
MNRQEAIRKLYVNAKEESGEYGPRILEATFDNLTECLKALGVTQDEIDSRWEDGITSDTMESILADLDAMTPEDMARSTISAGWSVYSRNDDNLKHMTDADFEPLIDAVLKVGLKHVTLYEAIEIKKTTDPIILSDTDFDNFIATCERGDEPNQYLKDAFARALEYESHMEIVNHVMAVDGKRTFMVDLVEHPDCVSIYTKVAVAVDEDSKIIDLFEGVASIWDMIYDRPNLKTYLETTLSTWCEIDGLKMREYE